MCLKLLQLAMLAVLTIVLAQMFSFLWLRKIFVYLHTYMLIMVLQLVGNRKPLYYSIIAKDNQIYSSIGQYSPDLRNLKKCLVKVQVLSADY